MQRKGSIKSLPGRGLLFAFYSATTIYFRDNIDKKSHRNRLNMLHTLVYTKPRLSIDRAYITENYHKVSFYELMKLEFLQN